MLSGECLTGRTVMSALLGDLLSGRRDGLSGASEELWLILAV